MTSAPVMLGDDIKVWFPIKRGFLRKTVDHVKAVDGIDVSRPRGSDAREWSANRLRQDDAWPCLTRMILKRGEIHYFDNGTD
jgi:microcin C transport system ATP-binding protein